jgi:hypothetical protein
MIYVRLINPVITVTAEQFVLSRRLSSRTAREEIFLMFLNFATGSVLDLCTFVGVTMDGVAAITGRHSVADQRIRNVTPNTTSYHCFIRHEVLVDKVKAKHFMK